jgi:feruloyl esterase
MFLAVLFSAAVIGAPVAVPCGQLKSLSLSNTIITAADFVPTGPFRAPNTTAAVGQGEAAPESTVPILPAHCRVAATLKPSADSNIDIEIWLPAENWNRKFQAVGNGNWGGVINYAAMVSALQEGYATASTDTGHKGDFADASFALGHPEKLVDYAYRAVHEMTAKSKAIIAAFYDRGPRFSYWNGCSTGGSQALMEAERYPEDFDGIIAGAPVINRTPCAIWWMSVAAAVLKDKESFIPPAKLDVLSKAVLNTCDARDGLKDGILTDPRQCRFDPSTLLCRAGDEQDCLTAPQVETVKKICGPLKTKASDGLFPGLEPGTERFWTFLIGGPDPPNMVLNGFKYVFHEDPSWDLHTFDVDRDLALAQKYVPLDATNPDMRAFKARGGKLLIYHGWSDNLIPPENSINYYSSVLAKMGSKQSDWLRLFMVPGMYPQVARYKGIGSTNDAMNFACKAP